jgi:hypothetical protein
MTMDPSRPVAPSTGPTSEAAPTWSPAASPSAPVPAPTRAAPVAPVVAVAPHRKSGGVLNVLLVGAAIIAIGGVAFAAGRTTAPASVAGAGFAGAGAGGGLRPGGSFAPGAGGQGGQGGFGQGGSLSLDGTVTAIDADSVTVTLDNGSERTFTLNGTTTYREATDSTVAAVAVGDNVSVQVAGGGRGAAGTGAGGQGTDLTATDITVAR